jgi:hypothetical protein
VRGRTVVHARSSVNRQARLDAVGSSWHVSASSPIPRNFCSSPLEIRVTRRLGRLCRRERHPRPARQPLIGPPVRRSSTEPAPADLGRGRRSFPSTGVALACRRISRGQSRWPILMGWRVGRASRRWAPGGAGTYGNASAMSWRVRGSPVGSVSARWRGRLLSAPIESPARNKATRAP